MADLENLWTDVVVVGRRPPADGHLVSWVRGTEQALRAMKGQRLSFHFEVYNLLKLLRDEFTFSVSTKARHDSTTTAAVCVGVMKMTL